jgi:hypothetical protein
VKRSIPVMPESCASCPFRKGSKYAYLKEDLAKSATTVASRICHSTGTNNAINHRTGKPARICRGARDLQLEMFVAMGFISEPTDAAWQAKCDEMGLK